MRFFTVFVCTLITIQSYCYNISPVNGFIENKGQMIDMNGDLIPNVFFKIETKNLDCYITENGITYLFKSMRRQGDSMMSNWQRVDLSLKNATIKKENILKEQESNQGVLNYYLPHCKDGILGVKEYKKIIIKNVYPNIDWVFYNTSDKGFKYDFILHKGARVADIELIYGGKNKVIHTKDGRLIVSSILGEITEMSPISFLNNKKINSHFIVLKEETNIHGEYDSHIGFKFDKSVPEIIKEEELVIDPILEWSTFYGGSSANEVSAIDTDSESNIIVTGTTMSLDFPVLNGGGYYQQSTTTVSSAMNSWNSDGIVVKFDKLGNRLWATCIGGSVRDILNDVAIDNNNNIFLTGRTQSIDFPLAFNTSFFEQDINQSGYGGLDQDAIIIKMTTQGVLQWSTYFGGESDDIGWSIAVNKINNDITIVGQTDSHSLPLLNKSNAFNQSTQPLWGSPKPFISTFDNNGTLLWSTFFGGTYHGLAASVTYDVNGNLFVLGSTNSSDFPLQDNGTFYQDNIGVYPVFERAMFISKFDNNKNLTWSTYYHGSSEDLGRDIKTDSEGNVYVHGDSYSGDLVLQDAGGLFNGQRIPISGPLSNQFNGGGNSVLLKFTNSGALLWGTFVPAITNHYVYGVTNSIAIDPCTDDVYFSLTTGSATNIVQPISSNSYQEGHSGGNIDSYIIKINKNTDLIYATYLGGNGDDYNGGIVVDTERNLVVATNCYEVADETTYPLLQGAGYYDEVVDYAPIPGTNHAGGSAILMTKFLREYIDNGTITETSEDVYFCDSISYNNTWYYENQNITRIFTNIYGCDSAILRINLIENCTTFSENQTLHIPNVFTPNKDNENDTFKITLNGEVIKENGDLTMFNRWGEIVFESTTTMEWTGYYEPSGVYYYIFKYKNHVYKGFVTLTGK